MSTTIILIKKWIEFLTENFQEVPEKSLRLINHLIKAQQIWNIRIDNEIEFGVWQINEWNKISKINDENYTKTLKIIRENNLENIIEYQNSKGQKFTNKIEDVLFHIINHSTYHRAQIAVDIKNYGIEPINTDYIFYLSSSYNFIYLQFIKSGSYGNF
ncbi:DinB family protein [Capnocytophaga canis]|uniref:DinB family protein n=1 Tax=Capnocytophaga canis TaxID=1848903 RepID=UPI00370D570F